ncbi:hypothetical protein ACFXKC_35460 [Streptomyces sp. NPDC059340]|uniref:hypothetical protein n=1 Tax=Streptomyces sp. NPDC059340 TaxID=3346806 RepID=UPI00369BCFED
MPAVRAALLVPVAPAAVASEPSSAAVPKCGSLESIRLGEPYSGTVVRGDLKGTVKNVRFSRKKQSSGPTSVGRVTGSGTGLNGKPMTVDVPWSSYKGIVERQFGDYVERDHNHKRVGSYTCNTRTGAVKKIVAKNIHYYNTGGGYKPMCNGGLEMNCATGGIVRQEPVQMNEPAQGTVTLTSGRS